MRAAVIGGGLAGITAALALAEAGADVTLLEAKPRLGGATTSFERSFEGGDLTIDTGQHVFLRCCTAYLGLLGRLGVGVHAPLQPRFDVTVLSPSADPRRRRARLRRNRLPAPLHLLPTLLSYPQLSLRQRLGVGRAALGMRGVRLGNRVSPGGRPPGTPERAPWGRVRASLAALARSSLAPLSPVRRGAPAGPAQGGDLTADEVRFGDWLAGHGQDERTRRALWDLFSVASINVPGDDASLALAAKVVQTGLLGDSGAADIGVPRLPLGELHGTAAAKRLAELGGCVRLSTKVTGIEVNGTGTAGVTVEPGMAGEASGAARFTIRLGREAGEDIAADAVVLAVPHEAAARLIPPGALPPETVDGWAGLGAAPIVNVHVIYDRKVLDVPFAAGVDSPVQWVFDRTDISGLGARDADKQYLAISLSAADEYVNRTVESLREEFIPALADLLPAAREATVLEFFVTRERRATFRGVPGTARLRPPSATALPGLVLAGSWTATGWPDTMEGAVRSGLNAVVALKSQPVTEENEVDSSTVSTADSARGVRP